MPNKIFIVDESVAGDDLQFVVRAALPQTITGLAAGDYTIINTADQGEVTVTAAAPTVPAQPAAPSVSSITSSGATISWTAPANGGSAITSYTLDWREVGGSSTPITGATSPYGLTGLDPATDYEVRVTAINAIGSSTPSAWTAFETSAASAFTPVVEITPSAYTGPTLNIALPAASGGYRTLGGTAGSPYAHSASFGTAISNTVYTIMAIRRDGGFSDVLEMLSLAGGTVGGRTFPIITAVAFGYGDSFQPQMSSDGDDTPLSLGSLDPDWHVIEMWADGGSFNVAIDGGTVLTDTNAMTTWSVAHFGLRMAHAATATTFDLAAARIFDSIPDSTERAAQRTWAGGLIP